METNITKVSLTHPQGKKRTAPPPSSSKRLGRDVDPGFSSGFPKVQLEGPSAGICPLLRRELAGKVASCGTVRGELPWWILLMETMLQNSCVDGENKATVYSWILFHSGDLDGPYDPLSIRNRELQSRLNKLPNNSQARIKAQQKNTLYPRRIQMFRRLSEQQQMSLWVWGLALEHLSRKFS